METAHTRYFLATDIDGTLTARGNTLSAPVRAAVREATASGIDVFLVTARPLKATLPIHQELQLTTALVCLNGAIVYAPGSLDVLAQQELPGELLGEAHALTVQVDPGAHFYLRSEDRYAATSGDNDVVRSFLQRSAVAPDACAPFEQLATLYRSVHRLGIIPSRRELLPELRQRLASRLAGRGTVVLHDDLFLSVGPVSATKLDAVQRLSQRLGYAPHRVFAIGDGEDDREMLRWAALGVAMGNGPLSVRQDADLVCPPVEEDGFCRAVEHFLAHAGRAERMPESSHRVEIPDGGFTLRYGENPFLEEARIHRAPAEEAAPPASLLDGHVLFDHKLLSYSNVVDLDATLRMLWEFSEPTVVCSKHTHPALIASDVTVRGALEKVVQAGDSSLFGSVLAFNRPVDAAVVQTLGDLFVSVVLAPSCSPEAVTFFAARRDKTQVLLLPALVEAGSRVRGVRRERRAIWGGAVEQEYRTLDETDIQFTPLGNIGEPLTEAEWRDLRFGMKAVRYAKTNAAVVVHQQRTLAIANAQTTRYWAVELALQRSKGKEAGAILVCDGRFSHRDAFDLAARSGVGVIAAPRGLVPEKVIDAWAQEQKARLVLFSTRLFHS